MSGVRDVWDALAGLRGERAKQFRAGVTFFLIGMSFLAGCWTAKPDRSVSEYRVESVTYDGVSFYPMTRAANAQIGLKGTDGIEYRIDEETWRGVYDDSTVVRRVRAQRMATVWIRGAGPRPDIRSIVGLRAWAVSLNPEKSVAASQQRWRAGKIAGVVLGLIGLAMAGWAVRWP